MHTYRNEILGFSFSYPQGWEPVPTNWMKRFMGRAKRTSPRLAEYLNSGSQPFVILRKVNCLKGYAVPALKCQAYAISTIEAAGGIDGVIDSMIKCSEEMFPDFKLEELQRKVVVCGVVGAKIVASMSVLNEEGESYHGTSEVYFLPTINLVFLVVITGTSESHARPSSELSAIMRSVRIK